MKEEVHQIQYQSTCCHSENCRKTMSVVLVIKGSKTHFAEENGEFVSDVFRESSRKLISDTWMPRKKNAALRKVRERDGEREGRIEHKVSGFRQLLTCKLPCSAGLVHAHDDCAASHKICVWVLLHMLSAGF